MLRNRVIPALLLRDDSLVKTIHFDRFTYVGDPINTVRIFNELEVDELLFLDIDATRQGRQPNFDLLSDIASECFMPLAYGGGIRDIESADKILRMGFEKVVLNSYALENPDIVAQLADRFGSQAVIVSIDVRKPLFGPMTVHGQGGRKNSRRDPVAWAAEVERRGAGEILLTSIAREGTWSGYDVELTAVVSAAVNIPVIAHGGAGSLADIGDVIKRGGASAVGVGSMVVFQKKGMGVLVNFPKKEELEAAW